MRFFPENKKRVSVEIGVEGKILGIFFIDVSFWQPITQTALPCCIAINMLWNR